MARVFGMGRSQTRVVPSLPLELELELASTTKCLMSHVPSFLPLPEINRHTSETWDWRFERYGQKVYSTGSRRFFTLYIEV